MASFRVEGGHRLKGEIIPQGAKNEALQILCAVLLTSEKVTIHKIPNILIVGMENMWTIFMNHNSINLFVITISCNMGSLINNNARIPSISE